MLRRNFIHSVSRLGKESKLSLLSLLTELYNFYFCVVSLSQNALSGSIWIEIETVCSCYPIHIYYIYVLLLVLLLLCLCKSFKELSLFCPRHQILARKRMQRYEQFFIPANILRTFFEKNEKFSHSLTIPKTYTLLYYIEKGKKGNRHCCQFPSFTAANPKIDVTYGNICCAPSAVERSSPLKSSASSAIWVSRQ